MLFVNFALLGFTALSDATGFKKVGRIRSLIPAAADNQYKHFSNNETGQGLEKAKKQLKKRDQTWEMISEPYATWNLIMITFGADKKQVLPPVGHSTASDKYYYADHAGAGVDVYVVEPHDFPRDYPEYQDRVELFEIERELDLADDPLHDLHGKCVASLAAGKTLGVAKKATIIQCRFPNMYSLTSGHDTVDRAAAFRQAEEELAQWLNATIDEHLYKSNNDLSGQFRGSIINLSFSYKAWDSMISPDLIEVLRRADEEGVLVVASAGDQGQELKGGDNLYFPCQLPGVICVGGIDRNLKMTAGQEGRQGVTTVPIVTSNYGRAVSIWAPGSNILCPKDNTSIPGAPEVDLRGKKYIVTDTTDWAAAHVSGIAAIMLSYDQDPESTAKWDTFRLRAYLLANGKRDLVRFPPSQSEDQEPNVNILANTGILSRRGSSMPFGDTFNVNPFLLEIEKQVQLTLPETELICYEKAAFQRIKYSIAERLNFRLLLEIGHVNMYRGKGARYKVIPCHEDACVYLAFSKDHPSLGETVTQIFKDTRPLQRYVEHIMRACSRFEQDADDQEGTWMTGGMMKMAAPGYSELVIVLQRSVL